VNTYAFDNLPSAREWGVNRPFDDKSTNLCKPGTNEPYTIWFVGRVSRTWFFDRESNPAAQIALNFLPVNDATGAAAQQLLCMLSKPAIGEFFNKCDIVSFLISDSYSEHHGRMGRSESYQMAEYS
jgi:hypothetical protein